MTKSSIKKRFEEKFHYLKSGAYVKQRESSLDELWNFISKEIDKAVNEALSNADLIIAHEIDKLKPKNEK